MLAGFGQFAAVDVNTANDDALRGIKGIGPAKAKAILDERDSARSVQGRRRSQQARQGHGRHTVERLQAEGLAVGPAGATAARGCCARGCGAATGRRARRTALVVVKK